jgi:hypothetical protein
MHRLLRWADWDIDGVRDDVRDHVVAELGDRGPTGERGPGTSTHIYVRAASRTTA